VPNERWAGVKERAVAELGDGSDLRVVFPALRSRESGHGLTLMPFGSLYRWFDRAVSGWRSKRVEAQTGFPLRPRMIVGITDTEVVVWSASARWPHGRWRLGNQAGRVRLDQVVNAEAPTVGTGWRTLNLRVFEKAPISILVPALVIDDLVVLLSQ
jgi:hypothetical protein